VAWTSPTSLPEDSSHPSDQTTIPIKLGALKMLLKLSGSGTISVRIKKGEKKNLISGIENATKLGILSAGMLNCL
jgi:hypothetical protein